MKLLRKNGVFLTLTLLLVVLLSVLLGCIPKGELHLLLCDRHTPLRDIFYRYYTQVGEWVPYVVCVGLLFHRYGSALFTTSCVLLSGAVTQILKRIVDAPRPLTWFAMHYPDIQLPLVDGVHMSRYFSFPSGHTTTFFAFFFALSIIVTHSSSARKPIMAGFLQVFFFCCAALGGYSRIYLSQHFTADVLGGICIGTLLTAILYPIYIRMEQQKWWESALFRKKTG